nr:hypothetical protein L203_00650 [Cryptococcus depauperatus CBS 7841]
MSRMAYAESEESIAYRVDLPSGPLIHLELQNTVAWPGGAERDRVKYAVQDLCGLLNGVGHIDGSYLNLAQVPAKSDPCDGRTSLWNLQSTAWHPPFSQHAHDPRHEHHLHPAQPASQELEAAVDVNDLQDIMHEEREVQAERLRHEDYFQQFPEQYRRREEVVREMQRVDEHRWAL